MKAIGAYFDGRDIVSWTRDDAGRRVLSKSRAEFACYLPGTTPTELIDRLRQLSFVKGLKRDGDYWRIGARDRDVLYRLAGPKYRDRETGELRPGLFASQNLTSYEADLDPVRRWALENLVEVQLPRRCYLDLEGDSRFPPSKKDPKQLERARILSWTIGDDRGDESLVTGCLEADTDEAERDLILDLLFELEAYDQVAAWYGDGYDFPLLSARIERLRIRADVRRWLFVDHLPVFRRMNISSSKSGDEKQSMSLDNVAKSVAGMRKVQFDASKTYETWAAGGESRELLCRYNAHDVRCMIAIEQKTGYLGLHNIVSQTCGVFPDTRASNPLRYVDNMMLRLARTRGMRLPSMFGKSDEDEQQFVGAYVMAPETGLLRDVHVVDFASMYPSIIRSWNMSFETITDLTLPEGQRPSYLKTANVERAAPPEGCCESPSGAIFRNEPEGLLCLGVGEALKLRKEWTKKKASFPPESPEWIDADRRATAYKIVANTFYGVQGCRFFRLFNEAVAEGVTKAGQWMIKAVSRAGEDRGMRAVYGDTDSAFLVNATVEQMNAFVDYCNKEFFPGELAKMGAIRMELKLEYEKAHELVLMVGKKRYAARYLHYKGQAPDASTKPEVKGLEYKRGDTARLARQMQAEVIDMLLGGGVLGPRRPDVCTDPEVFKRIVQWWRVKVLEGELTKDEVVISKRLTKDVDDYVRKEKKGGGFTASPPHVEVARLLLERGHNVEEGAKIDYYVADGSANPAIVKPAEDWDGNFDRFALWEDAVYPATQRVLEAAFPHLTDWWGQQLRVRPKKLRHVLPGQQGFGFGEAPPPKPIPVESARDIIDRLVKGSI